MLRISVFDSKELQATILSIRAANKDLQGEIRRYTRAEMLPEWRKGLAQYAKTGLENTVLVDTSRVAVSNQNVQLSVGTVGSVGRGRHKTKAATLVRAAEFGANRSQTTTYTRRGRRGPVTVHARHTRRQFKPVKREGYVVYQAAADLIPRFASLWVQTTMKTIMDAVDGGHS